MSLKPSTHSEGLSALETTDTNRANAVPSQAYLPVHLHRGVFKYLLQSYQTRQWVSTAGVILPHVHCYAWVNVLGIVSAEFLSGAVISADRQDSPLAPPLFRQVFVEKKKKMQLFQLRQSQHPWRKDHHWEDNAGEGWGSDRLAEVKGDLCQNELVNCFVLACLSVCSVFKWKTNSKMTKQICVH